MRRLERCALWAAVLAIGPPAGAERLAPGDHELALLHGGRTRYALVHVPAAAARGMPLPLVLSFHGGGGEAAAHRDWTELDVAAEREGFVAVYPYGTARWFEKHLLTWNAGACCGYAAANGVDDVGFALALLEAVARGTPVDATRVYATGLSNGAMMAYRLAHDAGDRIAGIMPVAGALRIAPFAPRRPMPIVHLHSIDDPRARFEGGPGPLLPFLTRVAHPPVALGLGDWAVANGCPEPARAVETLVAGPGGFDAGHTATRYVYGPCASGAEITLWKLTGAGHVWPGVPPRYSEGLLGRASAVVDANSILCRMMARERRADAPPLPAEDAP
jgi:polyhydroxybutyrate depolymerase